MAGGGRWTAGWPWLRIRLCGINKNRLLLDDCLRHDDKEEWKEEMRIDLLGLKDGVVAFELWMGDCNSTDLLQFVTAWSVDLQQWIISGAASRWYEVQKPRRRGSSRMEGEYHESVKELESSVAYVCIGIFGAEEQTVQSSDSPQPFTIMSAKKRQGGFQFVLPQRSIARSGKLRAIRVGQIVHEVGWALMFGLSLYQQFTLSLVLSAVVGDDGQLRTDVLHDLLPLTLYGRSNGKRRQRPSTKKPKESGDEMTKALMLLQFSCQYANYCVSELDQYSRCVSL